MSKKNSLVTIDRTELTNKAYLSQTDLYNAIEVRVGGSHIEILTDDDGNEYTSATYELKAPVGDRKEVTIRNTDIATHIERVNKSIAMGDVAYFMTAKELENFTETDAIELGFDNVTQMCVSLFGLAKSTVENYRRLSRYFVNADYTLKGTIPSDTPISTLNQLLSLVTVENDTGVADISDVEKLFTTSIITPYMKQNEVKARLSKLKTMETEKRLSELTEEETANVRDTITQDSADRKANKGKKKDEKTEKKNTVVVSDNPQVLVGEAMDKLHQLEELFKKMEIVYDFTIIKETLDNYIEHNS